MPVEPFPKNVRELDMPADGTTLHVRAGGTGPAVVLLHGFGETGDMWAPLAARLIDSHQVVAPDLRGMGLSSHPAGGYDKKTQAHDIAAVLDELGIDDFYLVAHDIGLMVAFALAAEHPTRVRKFVAMDAPIPGVGPWDELLKNPILWHFHFGGPDMERLVKGRERIYLDRFWNDFSFDPHQWDEASREHYARLYALPGGMHSSFEQFKAFEQDAIDNKALLAHGKLPMPVLALGGVKSFGDTMAVVMRAAANDVQSAIVPNAGHWLLKENPGATMSAIVAFIDASPPT